ERDRRQALGLVHLAVAREAPHGRVAGVDDAAVTEVPVEPGLVRGLEEPESHRDGRELPEVAAPRVRVARQPAADLAPEPVELRLVEAPLEVRTRVDARRRVALEEHLVADARVATAEEVVEADLVQRRGGRVGREVTAETVDAPVCPR